MQQSHAPRLVSVIVPTYNRAPLLAQTLESVRLETYRPIELIVVDDGSTDDTPDVVRRFKESAEGDLEVKYIAQTNQGAAAARNRGLEECIGEFIQFLDSDDLLHPEKISAQAAVMQEEPEVDYVFSAYGLIDVNGMKSQPWQPSDFPVRLEAIIDFMLGKRRRLRWPLCSINGLYRRSLCLRVGPWDAQQRYMEDPLYNVTVLLRCKQLRYVPFVHAWVRRGGQEHAAASAGQIGPITDICRGWRKMCGVLETAHLFNRRRRSLIGTAYCGHARDAFIAGGTELGMELLDEGLRIVPISPAWAKLRATRVLYRLLGTRGANALFRAARGLVRQTRSI